MKVVLTEPWGRGRHRNLQMPETNSGTVTEKGDRSKPEEVSLSVDKRWGARQLLAGTSGCGKGTRGCWHLEMFLRRYSVQTAKGGRDGRLRTDDDTVETSWFRAPSVGRF